MTDEQRSLCLAISALEMLAEPFVSDPACGKTTSEQMRDAMILRIGLAKGALATLVPNGDRA